eukprot:TRINITY_DN401_c0_g1_i13.p1 TRINITY_DN401_c0_g1~~TRINITY_DN401_c0_g1_i13.p1  ORF type:complete len:353 (-),score=38.81 TRINITY_DN401_c0_g1_i13:2650-3708(-)
MYPCFISPFTNKFIQRNRFNSVSKRCHFAPLMTASKPLPDEKSVVSPDEWDLRLGSPCKINLFLRVMGKREDGFHELASLFQSISLHDTIYFSVKTDGDNNHDQDSLECDKSEIPTDPSNLILRAIRKFREKTGIKQHFRIRLEKRIPHQAGLGGGSANAATALWAVNQLCGKPCTTEELAQYGAEFGSDISFFLSEGTAYCTGRGEIMEMIPRLPPQSLYIVKPDEGLSTAEVFKNMDMSECSDKDPRELLRKMQEGVIFADFVNDLEVPSFRLMPKLKKLKEDLYKAGFNVVLMSGSGTSFFCLGHPWSSDFMEVFPAEHNVQVFKCFFHGRRYPDMWYFEQPPLTPKKS